MNEKKKTVREWLNELPEPIRTRALSALNRTGNNVVQSLKDAIKQAFWFDDIPESFEYWTLVLQGNYSEACALLGETLQTEQTEPDLSDKTDTEILRMVKDNLAIYEYNNPWWHTLTDTQRANLVDKVAIRYAELVNNQKQ